MWHNRLMTRYTLLLCLLASLLTGCRQRETEHQFRDIVRLPMTPVKDQGKTELCWAYAMLATIETEHLLRGDSVNLSPQYLGRMLKRESQRAMCQTALNLMARYGMVGYDVLPDDATPDLPTPKNVFMLGARYTPLEFAHSVCAPDEYIGLTSIPDSPYYKKVTVPVPDNWEGNRLLNVPIDTLHRRINHALKHRHPVCWESAGHAMAIVGVARDENDRLYYILKNSWGPKGPHGGLVYMPASRLWRDMIAVYLTKEAYGLP